MNLKELRKERNLTQKEVADKAGISLRAYQSYEREDISPSLTKVYLIAEALKVDIYDIDMTPSPPETPKTGDDYFINEVKAYLYSFDADAQITQITQIVDNYSKMNNTGRQELTNRSYEMTEIKRFTDPD